MNKRAVIDLGTNTFHLLIAERDTDGSWKQLLRERIFVKLAEDGIERIGDRAFARGMDALRIFRKHLDENGVSVESVPAYGTAALRTASNGPEFLRDVLVQTGVFAEAIDGKREALLIFQGVRQAVPFPDNRVLVMDIGGGSVEMVLAEGKQVLWQCSFPVGVAVLFRRFHKSDPIAAVEIAAVEAFLDEALTELWAILAQYPTPTLIGAAGAFDIIDHLLLDPLTKPPLYGWIPVSQLESLHDRVLKSTLYERENWKDLVPERREMIVVGMILIRYIIRRGAMQELYTSTYSMKEGMLADID